MHAHTHTLESRASDFKKGLEGGETGKVHRPVNTQTHTHIQTLLTHTFKHIFTQTHTHVDTQARTHATHTHAHTHTHTHTHTHMLTVPEGPSHALIIGSCPAQRHTGCTHTKRRGKAYL